MRLLEGKVSEMMIRKIEDGQIEIIFFMKVNKIEAK